MVERRNIGNRISIILIMVISLCYNVVAASVTAAAVFEITNRLPAINLGLYNDPDFEDIAAGFNNGDTGYLRIDISDGNGYGDINYVGVRMVERENETEINVEGYEDFLNATFLNGEGDKAVYYHQFIMPGNDNEHRFYVKVIDGEDETISSIDFKNNVNIGLTGAAVARPERRQVIEFFANIWKRIKELF